MKALSSHGKSTLHSPMLPSHLPKILETSSSGGSSFSDAPAKLPQKIKSSALFKEEPQQEPLSASSDIATLMSGNVVISSQVLSEDVSPVLFARSAPKRPTVSSLTAQILSSPQSSSIAPLSMSSSSDFSSVASLSPVNESFDGASAFQTPNFPSQNGSSSVVSFTTPFLNSLQYPTALVRFSDLSVVHCNDAALELFGRSLAQLSSMKLSDIFPGVRKKFSHLRNSRSNAHHDRRSGSYQEHSKTSLDSFVPTSSSSAVPKLISSSKPGNQAHGISRLIKAKRSDGSYIWVELAISELHSEAWFMPVVTGSSSAIQVADRYLLATFRELNRNERQSRYHSEFDELGVIGKGGYGIVYRVKNKIDGQEYAIKKVKLSQSVYDSVLDDSWRDKFIREVQTFARISDHPNVVRYYAAWTEALNHELEDDDESEEDSAMESGMEKSGNADVEVDFLPTDSEIVTFAANNNEGSASRASSYRVKFQKSPRKESRKISVSRSHGDKSLKLAAPLPESVLLQQEFLHHNDDDTASSLKLPQQSKKKKATAILYIQMQLCPFNDLRRWILTRSAINEVDNLAIFSQIVEGVNHIHQKGFVHRDIKPANIFIDNGHVFLGDFGLAKSVVTKAIPLETRDSKRSLLSQSSVHLARDASSDVEFDETDDTSSDHGTYLYAAPESIHSTITTKSDMFSLGILLAELFSTFGTGMERVVVLSELRHGKIPQEMEAFPQIIPLLKSLLLKDPGLRPSARDILSTLEELKTRAGSLSAGSESIPITRRSSTLEQPKSLPRSTLQTMMHFHEEAAGKLDQHALSKLRRRWSSPELLLHSNDSLSEHNNINGGEKWHKESPNIGGQDYGLTAPIFTTPMPSPVKARCDNISFPLPHAALNINASKEVRLDEKLSEMESHVAELIKQVEELKSVIKQKDSQIADLKSATSSPKEPYAPRTRLSARNSLSLLGMTAAPSNTVTISTSVCIVTSMPTL